MIKPSCKHCEKFRKYYYKGRSRLMPSGYGKCIKDLLNPVEASGVCSFFQQRNDEKQTLIRQEHILDNLAKMTEEIQEMLLVLASDKS